MGDELIELGSDFGVGVSRHEALIRRGCIVSALGGIWGCGQLWAFLSVNLSLDRHLTVTLMGLLTYIFSFAFALNL